MSFLASIAAKNQRNQVALINQEECLLPNSTKNGNAHSNVYKQKRARHRNRFVNYSQ